MVATSFFLRDTDARVHSDRAILPKDDLDEMVLAYSRTMHPSVVEHPGTFVSKIVFRAYTEWCLENPKGDHFSNYNTGLLEFVDKETHHLLARKGYRWNEELHRFVGLDPQEYRRARNEVLGAIVTRALDLNLETAYYSVGRNLRAPLKPYLER